MQVDTDTLEIQHARRAAEIASQVSRASGADLEIHSLEPNKLC